MILKALYDYYYRSNDLAPYGKEYKEIGFILVIDKKGNFIRFEDRRIDNKSAQKFLVVKSIDRSSAPKANYLYDNAKYVFGYSDKKQEERYFDIFKSKVKEIYSQYPNDISIQALNTFYDKSLGDIINTLKNDLLWNEISKSLDKKYSLFSFLIDGETEILAEKTNIHPSIDNEFENDNDSICIITGERSVPVETTTATLISGSQAKAKLVSFQVKSGYDSYGKEQGYNATISKESEFAYTTALNHMLSANSKNKFVIGNRTFLFWNSNNDEKGKCIESSIGFLFGLKEKDNPNENINQVIELFNSIYSGNLKTSLDEKFYILCLVPNSARIAISYYSELPLKDFAAKILKHFQDMEIVGGREGDKLYYSLYSILSSVTLKGNASDVTPNLPESVVKSIVQGVGYPYTLFTNCLYRIKAEQNITITRAAIIKAYINRTKNINEQKLEFMLDLSNTNQGYLCGRLFSVLDKIQSESNNQNSLKERFINAASSNPSTVFPTVLNLSLHHSEKLNEGRNIFFEQIKQEIIGKISFGGFPTHLNLSDQGRFFIGFYHQQQWFYTKNKD